MVLAEAAGNKEEKNELRKAKEDRQTQMQYQGADADEAAAGAAEPSG